MLPGRRLRAVQPNRQAVFPFAFLVLTPIGGERQASAVEQNE